MSVVPDIRERVAEVKRRVNLASLIGRAVKLRRAGREWTGLCPFHQERSPSFTVVEEKAFYHCFGCGAHGDALRFVQDHDGLTFMDALAQLEADQGILRDDAALKRDSARAERPSDYVDGRQAAAAVWQAAQGARGSLCEAFLRSRGLDPEGNGLLDVARFHPRCPAALWRRWEGPDDARRHAPALVAPMLRISGGPGERVLSLAGVHLTFLAPDGRGKAAFQPWRKGAEWVTPPSRVMWGGAARAAVPIPAQRWLPSGRPDRDAVKNWLVDLLDAVPLGPVVVGEGLESTQSLMARTPGCRMGFATLSLGNLQGAAAREGPKHAIALWNPQPAEEGAPFTFERPGRVTIGVDSDMKPTQPLWVQERRGELAVKRALAPLERAELCGALAAANWRAAGAERVTVVRPPIGRDFNDLDTGQAGEGDSAKRHAA